MSVIATVSIKQWKSLYSWNNHTVIFFSFNSLSIKLNSNVLLPYIMTCSSCCFIVLYVIFLKLCTEFEVYFSPQSNWWTISADERLHVHPDSCSSMRIQWFSYWNCWIPVWKSKEFFILSIKRMISKELFHFCWFSSLELISPDIFSIYSWY